jgi:hypothetical protein
VHVSQVAIGYAVTRPTANAQADTAIAAKGLSEALRTIDFEVPETL